jgi:hypothetical protein
MGIKEEIMINLFCEDLSEKEIVEIIEYIREFDKDIFFFQELVNSGNDLFESRLIEMTLERNEFVNNYNNSLKRAKERGIVLEFEEFSEI